MKTCPLPVSYINTQKIISESLYPSKIWSQIALSLFKQDLRNRNKMKYIIYKWSMSFKEAQHSEMYNSWLYIVTTTVYLTIHTNTHTFSSGKESLEGYKCIMKGSHGQHKDGIYRHRFWKNNYTLT